MDRQQTLQLGVLQFAQSAARSVLSTGRMSQTLSDNDINAVLDELMMDEEEREEKTLTTKKRWVLQLISAAEQRNEEFKRRMDKICQWLYDQFLPPFSENDEHITADDALTNIKNEFKFPKTDIPTFFRERDQSGFFANFDDFFEELIHSDEFLKIEPDIYEIIYEIVLKMIYIQSISDNYPMIYFPLTWSKKLNRDFLRCFNVGITEQKSSSSKSALSISSPMYQFKHDENEQDEEEEDKKGDIDMIADDKQKRFLSQFRLRYKCEKTAKDLGDRYTKSRCSGCRKRIDSGYSSGKYPIWRRIPFMNDNIDSHEFIFHDEQCVLLRKYKEAIRQFIFEYEFKEKNPSKEHKIPDLNDDVRLLHLYRDRNYILAVDSGKSKDELPQPSQPIHDRFSIRGKREKINIKKIEIFQRRKRRLAAWHLFREYELGINRRNTDNDINNIKYGFEKHELLIYIDIEIYGIALWKFCVKQLEIKNRSGLWQIMNFLASHLSTVSILKELEDGKDSFKRFEVNSLNILCQTVIKNSQFPAATALYLAAFMSSRGSEDESRCKEFEAVSYLFVEIAKELLNRIESDHLLAIRLELPTDINYLTILDIGLKFELDDFIEFHRLQPIFTTMWRQFEYLSPSRPFYTKDAGAYEAWKLLLKHPNKFYYTPLGLFIMDFTFYIMYLFVFTFFIYHGTYPYNSATGAEIILWIFNFGFILYEVQEMSFKRAQYFSDLTNYWDVFISINWIVLLCMRIYSTIHPERWIIYFSEPYDGEYIKNEVATRGTDFFVVYTCLFAIQCVLLWTRLLSKLQRSSFLAPLIQMIMDMIYDVIKFVTLLAIFMCGFIFALHYVIAGDLNHHERVQDAIDLNNQYPGIIEKEYGVNPDGLAGDDTEYVPPLDTPSSLFLYVVQTLLGQQEWDLVASDQPEFGFLIFFNESRAKVIDGLIIVFSVLGTILLLNLLIALMASTYERVRSNSYLRVNFYRSLHTFEIVNKTALLPPPLNMFVLAVTICWLLTEGIIECITCCHFTFSVEILNPLKYSLREKHKAKKRRLRKMEQKSSVAPQQQIMDKTTDDDDEEEQELVSLSKDITKSITLSEAESDTVDGRYINFDGVQNNIYFEIETSHDEDDRDTDDDNIAIADNKGIIYQSDRERVEYKEAEKCCLFERLPEGTCGRIFCCVDNNDYDGDNVTIISSKNSKRYCRYCRNDMRNASGDIDKYFDLFRYHGQILDEADIKLMRKLCNDINYVHLCPHCFRPYTINNQGISNRNSRFQIMLEIISFYVFLIIVWIPLSILMLLPAFWVFIYSKCIKFTKPTQFDGTQDVLTDIELEDKHEKHTKHVTNAIKKTIDNKKQSGNSKYKLLQTDDDDDGNDEYDDDDNDEYDDNRKKKKKKSNK